MKHRKINFKEWWDKRLSQKLARFIRKSSKIAYATVFVAVVAFVGTSYVTADPDKQIALPSAITSDKLRVNPQQGQKIEQLAAASRLAGTISGVPMDDKGTEQENKNDRTITTSNDIKAVNVASTVADISGLSSSNSVQSSANSANVASILNQSDTATAAKQQIIDPTATTDIFVNYLIQPGDTAESVATANKISANTLRWANNLPNNDLVPGTTIVIPVVDGIIRQFQEGGTLQGLADKYGVTVKSILEVNNLVNGKVNPGAVLLIPGATPPENERPEFARASSAALRAIARSSSVRTLGRFADQVPLVWGNNYAYGYCTWYAYNRRAQLGRPIRGGWGNANTWASAAMRQGFRVSRTPQVGAVFQTTAGYYGHVGVVEQIYPDGSIRVSEMNYRGWGVRSERHISNPAAFNYIY